MQGRAIHYTDLNPGDIIFVRNIEKNFHNHVYVAASSDCNGVLNRMHAGVKPYPYVCLAVPLSADWLEFRGSDAIVFRIKDDAVRTRFMKILENWQEWAVPFDDNRHREAASKFNDLLGTNWYMSELPNMTGIPPANIEEALQYLRDQFDIRDAIKFALRREISPIKIKEEDSKGLRCGMYVFIALLAAHISDHVPAVTDKWPSRSAGLFQHLNNGNNNLFADGDALTEMIPEELRLSIRYCVPELLITSLRRGNAVEEKGTLIAPPEALLSDREKIEAISKAKIDSGKTKREKFRDNVMRSPSIK